MGKGGRGAHFQLIIRCQVNQLFLQFSMSGWFSKHGPEKAQYLIRSTGV